MMASPERTLRVTLAWLVLLAAGCGDNSSGALADGGAADAALADAALADARSGTCVSKSAGDECPLRTGGDIDIYLYPRSGLDPCPGSLDEGIELEVEEVGFAPTYAIRDIQHFDTEVLLRGPDSGECGFGLVVGLPEFVVDVRPGDRFTVYWRWTVRSDDDASMTWVLRRDGAILLAALRNTRDEVFDYDLVPEVDLQVGKVLCQGTNDYDPVSVAIGPGCEGKHPETVCCNLAERSVRVGVIRADRVPAGFHDVSFILSDPEWVIPGADRVAE